MQVNTKSAFEFVDSFTLVKIFKNLSVEDFPKISRVCKKWHNIISTNDFWKPIFSNTFPDTFKGIGKVEANFKNLYRKSIQINKNIHKFAGSFFTEETSVLRSIFNFENKLILCNNFNRDAINRGTNLLFINHDILPFEIENWLVFPKDYFVNYRIHNEELFLGLEASIQVLSYKKNALNIEGIPISKMKGGGDAGLVSFDFQNDKLFIQFNDKSIFIFNRKNNYELIRKIDPTRYGKIEKDIFYFISDNGLTLFGWDIESNCKITEFKSERGLYSNFHIHDNKLFVGQPKANCIEMWDIESGNKLDRKFKYNGQNCGLITQMQVYDDKFFSLVHVYSSRRGFSSMYIWHLKNGQLLKCISHEYSVNTFLYMDNKYFFSNIQSDQTGSINIKNFNKITKKRKLESGQK